MPPAMNRYVDAATNGKWLRGPRTFTVAPSVRVSCTRCDPPRLSGVRRTPMRQAPSSAGRAAQRVLPDEVVGQHEVDVGAGRPRGQGLTRGAHQGERHDVLGHHLCVLDHQLGFVLTHDGPRGPRVCVISPSLR